jgi:putative secretion ATPase (PEP-CTERM system associated)
MYERFYNLRERPFSLSPDPDYLYPSRVHQEALSYLRYGIEGHAGFIVITGEIGSGKTTLLQSALRGLDHQTSVSRLVNTMLDARELIEAVMLDFGLEPGQKSKPHMLRDLARYLVEQRTAGRLALLVIDEAQNLSLPALEEVRMLSNLETEKSKLLQIVLIGQPNLRDVLARPELEQLRQRVTVRYHLQTLASHETHAYINHRLRRASIGAPLELSRDVTDLIHLHAQGLPRKINVIADAALLFGYGEERRVIDVDLIQAVIEELETTGVIAAPSTPSRPATASAAAASGAPAAASSSSELSTREEQVARRERQLAEQQRVLAEEYRLLRQHREAPPSAPKSAEPARSTWTPASRPAPAPSDMPASTVARRVASAPARTAAPPVARRTATAPSAPARMVRTEPWSVDRIWARVRRSLFALAKPVWED